MISNVQRYREFLHKMYNFCLTKEADEYWKGCAAGWRLAEEALDSFFYEETQNESGTVQS